MSVTWKCFDGIFFVKAHMSHIIFFLRVLMEFFFCQVTYIPHNFFLPLQKFSKMPFFFKHSNSELKMSVTLKCFDGIQREEISISDVRNEFQFQPNKHCFSDSLIVKYLCSISFNTVGLYLSQNIRCTVWFQAGMRQFSVFLK